ncbi:hypothetical protein HPB48_006939 [Haemaphysalis longicornis]|uniref:VWFC domain-containing protein n=1 Tax=Haemaphysalis longicornis TaxID=44386 RepID=A0A9J6GRB7_HAELO|nr:hypothetical protein HPB48_006939 [Haemaphysalis longicornis]
MSGICSRVLNPNAGCWKKGKLYRVGEPIPGTTNCETCYCSPRGPLCNRIECPTVALECDPVIRHGHCCPTEYICNKTQLHRDNDYKVVGLDRDLYNPQALPDDYRDNQPLARKSDDKLDYNSVPQPAYRPPSALLLDAVPDLNKTAATHGEVTQLPSHTVTTAPVTRFVPTVTPKEEMPIGNTQRQALSTTTPPQPSPHSTIAAVIAGFKIEHVSNAATTTTETPTPSVAYIPKLTQTNAEEKLATEVGAEVNSTQLLSLSLQSGEAESLPNDTSKELQHDSAAVDRPVAPIPPLEAAANKGLPEEGLHFSDLVDRLFFTSTDDNKEAAKEGLQPGDLSPVYGQAHLFNATSLGSSVIEARYPVKQNDELQPVYGSAPAYHRPTAESSVGEVASLKPRYGKPPSFKEESSEELVSQMHMQVSTTAEVHYEPASSLDVEVPSANSSSGTSSTNSTQSAKPVTELFAKTNTTAHGQQPHISISPKDLTPIYYDVHKYTTPRTPTPTYTTADYNMYFSTTTRSEVMAHGETSEIAKDGPHAMTTDSSTAGKTTDHYSDYKTTAKPEYNIWELMFFNRSQPEPTKMENATEGVNEVTNATSDEKKPGEEVAITTSVIKVRVGNTLNVSMDSSNQSKYRNVEEDGIIVSVYPEHRMDGGVTDLQDMPLLGQAESRAISSGDPFKDIQHSGDKAKSPNKLTQVISDIIKAHKSEEPEVITAPNIDFSKPNVMTVKVSPSNSFKVFSTMLLDKANKSQIATTSTTEPPVDTAPWAPMGTDSSVAQHSTEQHGSHNLTGGSSASSSAESIESQASLTVQTQQLPSRGTTEAMGFPGEPMLHSTFKIVPFLAEDAIFKPATSTQSPLMNDTGAYPRIVNADPRDSMEGPEDVYLPPDSDETSPTPDNQVQRYNVNVWSTRTPTGLFNLAGGGRGLPRQPDIATRRKSVPIRWPTTASFSLKNSPTLKPHLLRRPPLPGPHNKFAPLYSTEETASYEDTTTPPTTAAPLPSTSQSPSGSQQLWNVLQVSGKSRGTWFDAL